MSDKYPDCASCAFSDGSAEYICDACDDGNQWEDGDFDFDDSLDIGSTNIMVSRLMTTVDISGLTIRPKKMKEAA
jgi:hypothetical protein